MGEGTSGNIVVQYTYDAWGKLLYVGGSKASTLGVMNPLTYRGYVYDRETQLYYLQSRYYNPEIGRFINADDVDLLGANGDFASLYLFAYCGNNPVSRADSNGHFWHLVVGGVIGGIIGAISIAASGGDIVDVLIGAAAGAAGGVLTASGAGVVVQALGSTAISMASNAASQINHIVQDETGETEFDVGDMLFDGAIGLACGAWGGNGASNGNSGGITAAGKQLFKRGFFNPQARGYYAKVAHNMGGEYVFNPLLQSLGKSAVGSTIVTGKNIRVN
ncbi:MAG: RHS repeat-associated core domain-containing protein [Ruminococcaceae bacterium]|nr:RHS repeat-associated core domain-containing protein [Oscillospiraceae bacterium]